MKTLALASLLMFSALAAFAQDASASSDKAPPAADEALRARVNKFYGAFVAGKFKDAYLLVADDSQDKFFQLAKDQYHSCEIIKTNYTENFTKATVVTSCKGDWRFHAQVFHTSFPLVSNWELLEGEWFWHYVKPTVVPTPFSPTGFVAVPSDTPADKVSVLPNDIAGAARGILSKVSLDKTSVRLLADQPSQDVVHFRNDLAGEVSLKIDPPNQPGLKLSVGKSQLLAHEQTTILFEWSPDDPAIQCRECARKSGAQTTVQLRVEPTGQVFPITVLFDSGPQSEKPVPPQVPTSPQK